MVLQRTEETEAKLVQSVSAARTEVADAEADANSALGEGAVVSGQEDRAKGAAPQSSVVQQETLARVADHKREAKLTVEDVETARVADEVARLEVQAAQSAGEKKPAISWSAWGRQRIAGARQQAESSQAEASAAPAESCAGGNPDASC